MNLKTLTALMTILEYNTTKETKWLYTFTINGSSLSYRHTNIEV